MRPLTLFGGVGLLLALAGASQFLDTAGADTPVAAPAPQNLTVGPAGSPQPQTMEEFLTAVPKDVDAYGPREFRAAGPPEPRVGYDWTPAGAPPRAPAATRTADSETAPPRTARATTRSPSP